MALVMATRLTAGLAIIFFVADVLIERGVENQQRWRRLVNLLIPFGLMGALLMLYNFARFGNWFEFGYSYQTLLVPQLALARQYGEFGLIHLWPNLYLAFLAGPLPVLADGVSHVMKFPYLKPNLWGMSIFFTSPILLYLFIASWRDWRDRLMLATALVVASPIFLYYGVGYVQFGYRYGLDFLPWLFWLVLRQYRARHSRLSYPMKVLIVVSAALNLYLCAVYVALTA